MARKLLFVTSNAGKVREAASALAPLGYVVEPRALPLVEVQADTLEEVARAKVADARRVLGDAAFFVDDAGLFVDALRGFPGVYSAYALRTIGVEGVLRLVDGARDRSARFEAVVGYWSPEDGERYFAGVARGRLAEKPRDGGHGFGFDPIFVPEGRTETFAELGTEEKNRLSHRGRAMAAFAAFLAR